jgi:predicted nuclease with TOPRIM domain
MSETFVDNDIVKKLQEALQKVKLAYIEQKKLNAELEQKLNEVSFGRDELIKENRELQKKIESMSNANSQKENELSSMIDEIDSLLSDENITSLTYERDEPKIQESIPEKIPEFTTQRTDESSNKQPASNMSIAPEPKAIDDSIDFKNVEDLLNSLNDD